jgi:hypothetical protein
MFPFRLLRAGQLNVLICVWLRIIVWKVFEITAWTHSPSSEANNRLACQENMPTLYMIQRLITVFRKAS